MKKLLSVFIASVMLLALCACGTASAPRGHRRGHSGPRDSHPGGDHGAHRRAQGD
jgi:Spy/CpxP family protein refolding chaperone